MSAFVLGSGIQGYIDSVSVDLDPSTDISNEDLAAIVVKATRRINLKLGQTYSYNPTTSGFSPTPTSAMGTFIIMQAECLLAQRMRSTAIKKGIRVKDEESEIDTTAGLGGHDSFAKDICGELEKLIAQYRAGLIGDNDVASEYGQHISYAESNIAEEMDHNGDGGGGTRDTSSPFDSSRAPGNFGIGRNPQ